MGIGHLIAAWAMPWTAVLLRLSVQRRCYFYRLFLLFCDMKNHCRQKRAPFG